MSNTTKVESKAENINLKRELDIRIDIGINNYEYDVYGTYDWLLGKLEIQRVGVLGIGQFIDEYCTLSEQEFTAKVLRALKKELRETKRFETEVLGK